MKTQSLNGIWKYRVGHGAWEDRYVPFSALAVGHSECKREFDLEQSAERVLLRFDGLNYEGKATLNGVTVCEKMVAYSEYTFDVTGIVKEKGNILAVELEDLSPAFGPSAGWENFGGITRNVTLIYKAKHYIEDVFFTSKLKNSYTDAEYSVQITPNEDFDGEYRTTLSFDGEVVDSCIGSDIERELKNVALWSPEHPNLYRLEVEMIESGEVIDRYTCAVGFREFKCSRHRFVLNGKEIFLRGVCKHEMYGNFGHTVPDELIEKDLRMIKETGCNYVRLVHYPHAKKTLEIADRLGLMVSEEPGLWWADTTNPEVCEGSLEALRRTILRDRNHASIVFWLCFNECKFTEQFLIDSARTCRECDPTRLVSGANCMSDEDTLKYYNLCGFDFYTMHPYASSPAKGVRSASVLHDKPLIFTEWGGYYIYCQPLLFSEFIHRYYDLYLANSDAGALAGACFWYWAEIRDFHRPGLACADGVLKEALVDKDRNPTPLYKPFCDAWRDAECGKGSGGMYGDYVDLYEFRAHSSLKGLKPAVCLSAGDYGAVLKKIRDSITQTPSHNRSRRLILGPVLQKEEVKGISLTPYALTDEDPIVFEASTETDKITLIGMVSLSNKGYPLGGAYGEDAARVKVIFDDGSAESFDIRNGIELTTAFSSHLSSMIDPRADRAERFAELSYDKNVENFVINRLELPLSEKKTVKRVEITSSGNGYALLVYGVYL